MPRVVPSQVVELIDGFYGWAKDYQFGSGGDLPSSHAPRLRAIVELINEIPSELLAGVSGEDYAELLIAKADVEGTIAKNLARGGDNYFPFSIPVVFRDVLSRCPDEFPAAASTDLAFVSDADLRASILADVAQADRAFSNGEWKAATVLAGSAIEALLLWAITVGPGQDVAGAAAGVVASGKKKPDPDPNKWDLSQYTAGARAIRVIGKETALACDLAREFRNLIHPGKAIRLNQECHRGTAHNAIGALDHVISDLG